MRFKTLLVVTIAAGIALAVAAGASAGTRPSARTRTSARIYEAFTSNGTPAIHVTKTMKGFCNGGSLAADLDDAWRCFSRNFVFDPCFSSSKAKGIVLCPLGVATRSGVKIKLSSSLPRKLGHTLKPSKSGLPWAVETTSGLKCDLDTGATSVINGRRANLLCPNEDFLWGSPNRKSEPWTMYIAPGTATRLTKKTRIKIAWF